MTDYYNYIGDPDRAFLAPTSLSANNLTMVYGIHFKAGADPNDIVDTVYKLLSFAADQSYPYIHVGCTGLQALFNELTDGSKLAFELIDAVVLPIAIAILGFNLRSYRHMLVAIVNLGCTLLLALAILVPVAKVTYFNPFAPSIFLTLGISICFDYSLFLLSRFREEMIVNGKSKEEAVFCCLEASGHVIMLSGTTIFFTFVLLIAFPQNILQSVGYGCGVIIFTAILANMTIGPSLLLTFNCLSKFDAVPNFRSCFCCLYKRTNSDPKVETNVTDTEAKEEKSLQTPKKDGLFTKTVDSADDHDEYFKRPETHDTAQEESQLAMKSVKTSDRPLTGPEAVKCPRQFWFRISYFVTRRSYITLVVAIGITIPFALEFSKMVRLLSLYPSKCSHRLISQSYLRICICIILYFTLESIL